MTFLPIVARELRVAARRRSTYWLRTGAALALLLGGAWLFVMVNGPRWGTRDVAYSLFCILTAAAVIYAWASGVWATADCLSDEKRQGTLGLLFLTDLRGYDVVLGKLVASSIGAFYCILAVVPMLAVPLLMGGVSAMEFARMALVALNTLFFSLATGMAVSALCRSAQKAVIGTLAVLLGVTAALPAAGAVLLAIGKVPRIPEFLLLPSVGYGYYLALEDVFKIEYRSFWWSMALVHGLGWLGLALASVVAPHSWQERPAGSAGVGWRERWRVWSHGSPTERAAYRRDLLRENAFFWLASRSRLKPALVWGVLGAMACIWVWGLAKYRHAWLNEGTYLLTAMFVNLLLRCWFAGETCQVLAEERKAGTLELLLSTPMTVRDILRGQWLALQRQFLGPVTVVLAIEALFAVATLRTLEAEGEQGQVFWAWAAFMGMLVADLGGIFWLGLWQGLTAKNPARAAFGTLWRILVVPWLGLALLMLTSVWVSVVDPQSGESPFLLLLGLWFGCGLAADIGFALYGRHKLLTQFRRVAGQLYTPPDRFWRWLPGSNEVPGLQPKAGA